MQRAMKLVVCYSYPFKNMCLAPVRDKAYLITGAQTHLYIQHNPCQGNQQQLPFNLMSTQSLICMHERIAVLVRLLTLVCLLNYRRKSILYLLHLFCKIIVILFISLEAMLKDPLALGLGFTQLAKKSHLQVICIFFAAVWSL